MKRTLALALAFAVACGVALGADYYEGLAAFKAGNYEAALEQWQPLAEAGFPEAQYQLARMYHRGYAVQDDAEAARLYRLAAEQGHLMAQNNLGVMYEQGRGVERDEAQAAQWYTKAAQEGLIVAQANLALLYDDGRGVSADAKRAAQLYRQAGDAGHVTSQYRLARLYEAGRGVAQSDNRAADWYRKAAKYGHAESQLALAGMYDAGRGVKRDPSKAAKWRRLATMQGLDAGTPEDSPAVTVAAPPATPSAAENSAEIAQTSEQTAPVEADPAPPPAPLPPPPKDHLAPALAAAFDAAEAGDLDAQYDLARRFETGDGLPISSQEAGKWYLAAAERGHGFAGYKLAFQYMRGRGIAKGKDLAEAYFWFSICAERGVGDAESWRERLEKKLSKRQIEQSREKLAAWDRR
jgi:TPR repeat protein